MNVRELVAELQKQIDEGHGDVEISTEGCDCFGECKRVEYTPGSKDRAGRVRYAEVVTLLRA